MTEKAGLTLEDRILELEHMDCIRKENFKLLERRMTDLEQRYINLLNVAGKLASKADSAEAQFVEFMKSSSNGAAYMTLAAATVEAGMLNSDNQPLT